MKKKPLPKRQQQLNKRSNNSKGLDAFRFFFKLVLVWKFLKHIGTYVVSVARLWYCRPSCFMLHRTFTLYLFCRGGGVKPRGWVRLQVLQELTAKERGDWTPLMAAAGSGSVECFREVLRALAERTSEERVRKPRCRFSVLSARKGILSIYSKSCFVFAPPARPPSPTQVLYIT